VSGDGATSSADRFHGASVLVTGGTGSFGRRLVAWLLAERAPRRVIVFSRDELKQHEMAQAMTDPRLRFFLGDVRDPDRLRLATRDVDVIVHAAALKQITACEYNPFEAVKTNVHGTQNVIQAALDNQVPCSLLVSTDKAVNPVNLYGATKACAEKLFVQANSYSGRTPTRFACVRYGNVVGSRGSVIPLFQRLRATGSLPITDERMTRFWITLDQAVAVVCRAVERMHGGEIFVPKIPSMRITDLAEAIGPGCRRQVIGIRAGEKLHEILLTDDEARHAVDAGDWYVIEPEHEFWAASHHPGERLAAGFSYRSDGNQQWLEIAELRATVAG